MHMGTMPTLLQSNFSSGDPKRQVIIPVPMNRQTTKENTGGY